MRRFSQLFVALSLAILLLPAGNAHASSRLPLKQLLKQAPKIYARFIRSIGDFLPDTLDPSVDNEDGKITIRLNSLETDLDTVSSKVDENANVLNEIHKTVQIISEELKTVERSSQEDPLLSP